MKKIIYFFIAFVLLSSCSSDDDSTPNLTNKLKQYPVDYRFYAQFVNGVYIIRKSDNDIRKIGNDGIFIAHAALGDQQKLVAYDLVCPIEWDTKQWTFSPRDYPKTIICNNCNSEFDIYSGKAIKGEAFNKNYSLVEYNVIHEEGYVFYATNPNYKGE